MGEHLLQAYLMGGQQQMLSDFCDGLDIEHDGKGTVNADLPETLDAVKLDKTLNELLENYDPVLVHIYLQCFNAQVPGGWPELTEKLENDERLQLD